MIGEPPADIMEGLVPRAQRVEEIRELDDVGVGHGRELLDPRVEDLGNVDVQRHDPAGTLGRPASRGLRR